MAFKAWLDEIPPDEDGQPDSGPTSTDRRRLSLEEVAWAIILQARDEIIEAGRWEYSPAVEAAEEALNEMYRSVLIGRGSLSDMWDACERWKAAGSGKDSLSCPALPAEGTLS